jgi:hypothetical protein
MAPSGMIEVYIHFGGTYCLHLQGRRVSQAVKVLLLGCLAYSCACWMETRRSFETLVNFSRATLQLIPEVNTLHSHRCEYLTFP